MFKFDFNLAADEMDEDLGSQLTGPSQSNVSQSPMVSADYGGPETYQFNEHTLESLIRALPGVISYSPLQIPAVSGFSSGMYLSKRDLYDARFQLISSGSGEDEIAHNTTPAVADLDNDLQYVQAPSDLVPGKYEGGLKTWECSIDLAACVKSSMDANILTQKRLRTLELGCGTAIPSLSLLQQIFSANPQTERTVQIHLQDYNDLVFRLVTLPNIILAWYMSPASSSFLSSYHPINGDADTEQEPLPPVDPTIPGDLALSPALLDAFRASLKHYGISLRFFSGSWENFDSTLTEEKYDVILTSETIYRTESLASLCDLMRKAYKGSDTNIKTDDVGSLEASAAQLSLHDTPESGASTACLVAAKLVYFGVGGGVSEFTRAIETGKPSACSRPGGRVNTVWKKDEGVNRVILEVQW